MLILPEIAVTRCVGVTWGDSEVGYSARQRNDLRYRFRLAVCPGCDVHTQRVLTLGQIGHGEGSIRSPRSNPSVDRYDGLSAGRVGNGEIETRWLCRRRCRLRGPL